MQFKNYGLHMYSVMGNLAREAIVHGDKEAAYALGGILVTHALTAGVITLIADPLRYTLGAYNALTGPPGARTHDYQADVRQWLDRWFGKTAGEIIGRGVPQAFGIDVHRRVGLANLLEIPEMDSFDKSGAGEVLLGLATGATGEDLQDMVDGVSKAAHLDLGGAFKAMMPRPFRDAFKAQQLATRGVTDSRGRTILSPDRISPLDVGVQALGFQPSRVSEFREGRNAVLQMQDEAKAERDQLSNRWLSAGSQEERTAIQSQINQFNEDPAHAAFRINRGQLLRDMHQRAVQSGRPFGLRMGRREIPAAQAAGGFANY